MIMAWHRSNQTSKRLHYIPGVGPMLATALLASVADPRTFRSGRNFSAWIGLVPKQHSSGGWDRLGSISKQGDRYLRSLFVAGALAVIRYAKIHGTGHRPWLTALLGGGEGRDALMPPSRRRLAYLLDICLVSLRCAEPGSLYWIQAESSIAPACSTWECSSIRKADQLRVGRFACVRDDSSFLPEEPSHQRI
jgi:hypothetical protein